MLNKLKPMDVIFVGGIFGAICTVLVIYGTWQHNKQSSAKTTRIESGVNKTSDDVTGLQKQNSDLIVQTDSLKTKLEEQSNKIDQLRQENNELSLRLYDKSLSIYKNITGDGTMPYLSISCTDLVVDATSKKKYSVVDFKVENKGKYPMKNLLIKIIDYTGGDMLMFGLQQNLDGMKVTFDKTQAWDDFLKYDYNKSFSLGTFLPGMVQVFL